MIAYRNATLALSLTLTYSSAGLAYPEFPSEIRAAAEMDCTPSCTICHEADPGEKGTASKDFVSSMLAADGGVIAGDVEAIQSAWDALGDSDADGDGATDVAELTSDVPSDPNDANLTPSNPGDGVCAAEVRYGCGAQLAEMKTRPSTTGWGAIVALISLALVGARRRGGATK